MTTGWIYWPFRSLVIGHLITGSIGLVLFWVAVSTRKGGPVHQKWGRVFVWMMLVTGTFAVTMSTLTLTDPYGTHPHFREMPQWQDERLVRALFGWMMQYLGALTISLAWHGWGAVLNKKQHARDRNPLNVALQLLVMALAVNVAVRGWLAQQPTMMGISVVGLASGATNLYYAFRDTPPLFSYLYEHAKALVGAAISAYTAFLAFGLVRLMPERAFNPLLWATPCTIGLAIIIFHQLRIRAMRQRVTVARAAKGAIAAPALTYPVEV
ncbi:MAG: hypothetical protein HY275_03375 [Gemmatimonadetes bacterium]|nr:hypothetical protein [Gemmatimonadota bacterium]